MLISCAVTVQLICAFVFANAKSRFSHDKAHNTKHPPYPEYIPRDYAYFFMLNSTEYGIVLKNIKIDSKEFFTVSCSLKHEIYCAP